MGAFVVVICKMFVCHFVSTHQSVFKITIFINPISLSLSLSLSLSIFLSISLSLSHPASICIFLKFSSYLHLCGAYEDSARKVMRINVHRVFNWTNGFCVHKNVCKQRYRFLSIETVYQSLFPHRSFSDSRHIRFSVDRKTVQNVHSMPSSFTIHPCNLLMQYKKINRLVKKNRVGRSTNLLFLQDIFRCPRRECFSEFTINMYDAIYQATFFLQQTLSKA